MSLTFKSATETTATVHFAINFDLPESTTDTDW
jgi:hypothetical protein